MLLTQSRSIISTYAHEGAKKYSILTLMQIQQGTVGDFLELFKTQKWISGAAYEKRQIELRYVFNEKDVVSFALIRPDLLEG